MATLDVSTEDWTCWCVLLRSPSGWPVGFKVRAPSTAEALTKARAALLRDRPEWDIALDQYGNPLIWREATAR